MTFRHKPLITVVTADDIARNTEPAILVLSVSRQEVESGNISSALERLLVLIDTPENVRLYRESLLIAVDGYDGDSRELFEIPEVRAFFARLTVEWPYWLWYLACGAGTIGLLMALLCETRVIRGDRGEVGTEFVSDDHLYDTIDDLMFRSKPLLLSYGVSSDEIDEAEDDAVDDLHCGMNGDEQGASQPSTNNMAGIPPLYTGSFSQIADKAYEDFHRSPCNEAVANMTAMWLIQHHDHHAQHCGMVLLRRLSNAGAHSAMFNLAIEIFRNRNEREYDKASKLLEKIVRKERGDEQLLQMALAALGDSYREGRGIKRSLDHALDCYIEAAEMGDAAGAYNAGLFFHGKIADWNGLIDSDRAARYYEIAMQGGSIKAQTNLGVLHACGVLTNSNIAMGESLLQASIDAGDAAARDALSRILAQRDLLGEGDPGQSSIAEGEFPPGSQLPWEHPDQKRILEALFPKDASDDSKHDMHDMVDRAIKTFLLNMLSAQRASGCYPDTMFANHLEEVKTSSGRKRVADFFANELKFAQRR